MKHIKCVVCFDVYVWCLCVGLRARSVFAKCGFVVWLRADTEKTVSSRKQTNYTQYRLNAETRAWARTLRAQACVRARARGEDRDKFRPARGARSANCPGKLVFGRKEEGRRGSVLVRGDGACARDGRSDGRLCVCARVSVTAGRAREPNMRKFIAVN